jgi:integrase
MAKTLTVPSIERLKPDPAKRREIPDSLLVGLYLVIQPSGARSWAVRYRHGGKPRKLTLGAYPALDLGTARERARQALQAVAAGRDPGTEKAEANRRAMDAAGDHDLLSTQLDRFYERHVKPNNTARTAAEVMRALDKDVRSAWGERRVQDITRRDVIKLLDDIVDRGKPIAANRALAYMRRFFNWLIERSVLETSPCDRVKAPASEQDRDRALIDDKLRWLWNATERLGYPFGPFVRLLLLTGQRRDEVAKARFREFPHRALWQIPKERTKNGIAHDVPLSTAAQEVIAALPRIAGRAGLLFTTSGETAISGYSNAKERLDKFMLAVAREEAVERGLNPDEVEIPEWRLHDLRRTMASGMARLGHAPHVVEAVLNHTGGTISGVAAVYNRYSYADEKSRALEVWGRFVMDLVEESETSNVVEIPAAAQGIRS